MKERTFKRPALRHRRRHLIKQLFSGWPWVVWLGAAITAMLLLPGGLHTSASTGWLNAPMSMSRRWKTAASRA